MAGYKLVEAVKKKGVYTTDNQVAIAAGIGRSNISNYKNTDKKPDGETALLLADLAGVTPREAYELMQGGYASIAISASLAIASTVYFSIITHLACKPLLNAILNFDTLYIMSNGRCYKKERNAPGIVTLQTI